MKIFFEETEQRHQRSDDKTAAHDAEKIQLGQNPYGSRV